MPIRINANIRSRGFLRTGPIPSGISLINITFGGLVNYQQTTVGPNIKWGQVSTGTADYFGGKSAYTLPSSTNGYIQYDITDNGVDIENFNTGMGLALSNALIPGDNYDYFIYVESATGNYKTFDVTNAYVDSGIPALTGDKTRIIRTGSSLSAEYFRGGSWIPIISFPVTTTAILYIYGGGFDIGTFEYIVNPKGFNIV